MSAEIHDLQGQRYLDNLRKTVGPFREAAERGEDVTIPASAVVELLEQCAALTEQCLRMVARMPWVPRQ